MTQPDQVADSPDQPAAGAAPGAAHAGSLAVRVAQAHGVETMFTLSGAHVFPMYDGAVQADPPMRLLDVRHEQTAAFAAEATGKLTRVPGLAVLTAGPGVTNGISAIAQAQFAGSPLVVVGGRAPANRWGMGSLQELDHPPIVAPVTKSARTLHTAADVRVRHGRGLHAGRVAAPGSGLRRRADGRVLRQRAGRRAHRRAPARRRARPRGGRRDRRAALAGRRGRCWSSAPTCGPTVPRTMRWRFVERTGLPTLTNGMGRGVVPGGHPLLVTKARGAAFNGADLVVVVGTPLDFRLGYGVFGGKDGAHRRRRSCTSPTPLPRCPATPTSRPRRSGDLGTVFRSLGDALDQVVRRPDWSAWTTRLRDAVAAGAARDAELLAADADPIHPARIYGELVPRLADDAVVIGDGGDFVSFAGKFVEPQPPGRLAGPGPLRLPGRRPRRRDRRPPRAAVGPGGAAARRRCGRLLADGRRHAGAARAARGHGGRQQLGVGAGEGPDADALRLRRGRRPGADPLRRRRARLGGAGETVTDPRQIGPALDRAFAAGTPYLVNVITDVTPPTPGRRSVSDNPEGAAQARLEREVTPADTARAIGSGSLEVLGTPRLLAWCEAATCAAIDPLLDQGTTSVGTRVSLDHLAASPVGARLEVAATRTHVDGRLHRFAVATRELGPDGAPGKIVASGEVTRIVVDTERFLGRL